MKLKRWVWLGVGTVLLVGGAILMATPVGWTLLGVGAVGAGAGITGHQLHDVEMENRAEIRAHHDAMREKYARGRVQEPEPEGEDEDDMSYPEFEVLKSALASASDLEREVEEASDSENEIASDPWEAILAEAPAGEIDEEPLIVIPLEPEEQPADTPKPDTTGIMGGLGF